MTKVNSRRTAFLLLVISVPAVATATTIEVQVSYHSFTISTFTFLDHNSDPIPGLESISHPDVRTVLVPSHLPNGGFTPGVGYDEVSDWSIETFPVPSLGSPIPLSVLDPTSPSRVVFFPATPKAIV